MHAFTDSYRSALFWEHSPISQTCQAWPAHRTTLSRGTAVRKEARCRDHDKLIAEIPLDRPAAEFKLETEFIEPGDSDKPKRRHTRVVDESRFRVSLVHTPPEFQVGGLSVLEHSITLSQKTCKFSYGPRNNGSVLSGIATALDHNTIRLELAAVSFVYTGTTKATFEKATAEDALFSQPRFVKSKGKQKKEMLVYTCPTFKAIVSANVFFLPAMFRYLPREPDFFSSSEVCQVPCALETAD